ncbi:MAG: DNA primase [Actinobacteria bacterium]|nr:DNA primase [Actinomycetota bacterium]
MARIREEDVEALRDKAHIIDVVSAYSPLKRSGGQTFKGLCPFHTEKTPSFTVDAAKGLWHCFGCGRGGNVYHFVQEVENLPFPEAVEWLARKSGFDLRYEETRPGEHKTQGVKARLLEANAAATDFFQRALLTSPEASQARGYLEGRGFGSEVARRWQLGWAPGRDALCKELLAHSFSTDEIIRADLGRKSERDGSLYDTFRGRIVFPTKSLQGDVVGFGARAMGDAQPKYLNSSETPVFAKSRLMYGLDRAKSGISRGVAIVVEGYTDVIALHEAGITEAVATNGVALGESHFELLKKFTDRIVLMFDADEAGRGATDRSFGIHHRIGLEVLVAPLPAGHDPADVVTEDGAEGIRKVMRGAEPLVQHKLEQTIEKVTLDTPEARSRAVREAAKVLVWQPDVIARHEYAFMAARMIGVDPDAVQRAVSEELGASWEPTGAIERDRDRRLPGHVKVELEALQILTTRTREVDAWLPKLSEKSFTSPVRRELFRSIAPGALSSMASAAEQLSPEALSLYTELTVGPEATDGDVQPSEVFARLHIFQLEREIKVRRTTLQEVNPINDPAKHDALFTELVGLEAERRDLLRTLRGDEA